MCISYRPIILVPDFEKSIILLSLFYIIFFNVFYSNIIKYTIKRGKKGEREKERERESIILIIYMYKKK